jgi:orotidine-5'-phosphate decarboxylase
VLRRPESLRALPSLAHFLHPRIAGDAEIGQEADRGTASQDADADGMAETGEGAVAGREGEADTGRRETQRTSAAELRELTELSDLLAELAGLVHDLSGLIVGLVTAAAGNGDRQARTFSMPPKLAELVQAHQELKSGQQALSVRLEASHSQAERTALRGSLAVLTERATRAVAAAAEAVTPQESRPSGTQVIKQESLPAGSPKCEEPPSESRAAPPIGGYGGSPPREEGPDSRPIGWRALPSGAGPAGYGGSSPREEGPDSRPVGWRALPSGAGPAGYGGSPPREMPSHRAPDTTAGFAIGRPIREETGVQRLAPVAVALDAPDIDVAAHWATAVTPHVSTVKIGLELYLRYGPAVVATVRGGSGVQVFLDLKLHDIPNTVAGAARAVAKLHPEILTVHAAGGADMIRAAVEAAPDTIVAGVTLLTSISDKDLAELGVGGSAGDAVRRMAMMAVTAGARGLVCSPQEVAAVRAEVGPGILLITPGIRLAGATSDDQARVATPEEALRAGADLLVIGRPITKAPDPGAAAAAIAASLRRAVLVT